MNVAYNTLHRGSQPLELGDQYWSMRDAIVQAELLIMRMLKFQVTPEHPHRVNQTEWIIYWQNVTLCLIKWLRKWIDKPICFSSFSTIWDPCKPGSEKRSGPNTLWLKLVWLCCKIFIIHRPFLTFLHNSLP